MNVIMIEQEQFEQLLHKVEQIAQVVNNLQSKEDKNDLKLYNIKQAAQELGITRQTLHKYIRLNIINDYNLKGNKIYFTRTQITNHKQNERIYNKSNQSRHSQSAD